MFSLDPQTISLSVKQTVTLVALVDPFLLIPLFLKITEKMSPSERSGFTRRVAAMVCAALFGAAFAGPAIFRYLELSISALQIAGGFVLFTMGIAMLLGQELAVKGHGAEEDAASPQVVPLAIPLLVGPGSISYVMAQQSTASAGGAAAGAVSMAAACAIAALVVWLAFSFAVAIGRRLRASHMAIVERLAGLLVTVMAIESFGRGLKGMFPLLAG